MAWARVWCSYAETVDPWPRPWGPVARRGLRGVRRCRQDLHHDGGRPVSWGGSAAASVESATTRHYSRVQSGARRGSVPAFSARMNGRFATVTLITLLS